MGTGGGRDEGRCVEPMRRGEEEEKDGGGERGGEARRTRETKMVDNGNVGMKP